MTRFPTRRLLTLALASAITAPAWAQSIGMVQPFGMEQSLASPTSFVVSDIRVDGVLRISSGTVLTYLPIERGDAVTEASIGNAIRTLYKTGFFEDVQLSRQGSILVVTLKERPAINKLTLSGNKDIKTEDLTKGLADIGLSEGGTFDRLALDRVTQELVRQYNNRGKYNVQINPTVTMLDRNRVDITIAVQEGKAAKIRHINLIGTDTFPQDDIRASWESQEHNWLSWYRRDDQYSKEKLSGDIEKLNSWYLDRGYIDFSLNSTQVAISPDKKDMYITGGVTEGETYTISSVKVTGDTVLPQERVDKMVFVREGQIFSRRLLEVSSDLITSTLANVGYAFAQVNPIPTVDREKRTVAINLQVVPGPRVNVRRIEFKGNTRTSDEVLRREMRQFEGAWYSQAAIDRSKVRLQRLGFFQSVEVNSQPVPGTPDQVDVIYNITETNSGSFSFGLGYSQLGGVTTSVQLSQNNFLGGGNRLAVEASRNYYSERYLFSFNNPYFTNDGVSLGYNLSYSDLDYSDFNTAAYSSRNIAAQAILGIPLSESDSISLMFGADSTSLSLYQGYTPQSIIDYVTALGDSTFDAWRTQLGWARDTRNDYYMPTRGMYQRISAEIALPGSTVSYYKLNYEFSKYWLLSPSFVLRTGADLGYGDSYGKGTTTTLCHNATTGVLESCNTAGTIAQTYTTSGLPFYENFYAGGVRSVRGFEDNTLGPRSEATTYYSEGQPLGGSLKTVGQLELIFPKLFDSSAARISAFVDVGNVFNGYNNFTANDLRASAGVALLWRAPIGPISISYAYPLRTKPGDEIERLQFTFGGSF